MAKNNKQQNIETGCLNYTKCWHNFRSNILKTVGVNLYEEKTKLTAAKFPPYITPDASQTFADE